MHVVIVGGGFGGISAARALKRCPVDVTLIDRSNHHLFQPLLYQVATAALSPADIATPIRAILRGQRNTEVMLAEVLGVDPKARRVRLADRQIAYDQLVIATGARHGYFGRDEWEKIAPGLKSIHDATAIRRKILLAFERAEMEQDPAKRDALLTFIVVGGGPTGVELASSISELARAAIWRDFRHISPPSARVILVEAGPKVLASFPDDLSAEAGRALKKMGVELLLQSRVEEMDADGVVAGGKRVAAGTIIWAAGVVASPAGKWLGVETDRAGRVKVEPDLTVPGHPEIFVIGDTASVVEEGKHLPGVAPVAMQQGRYVARVIARRRRDGGPAMRASPFHYVDKGNLAAIGRTFAVADFGGRVKISGFPAWLTWVVVHIYFLIGFRNRVMVLVEWAWLYLTFQRGARLIVD